MGLDKPKDSWLIPVLIIVISVLAALLDDIGREALRYDRVWLGQGELWRIVTGHIAHLSWPHLLINSAGLLLVWYLVGSSLPTSSWLLVITASIATMDLGFWFLNPGLHWYVGMSGLLHGMLAAGIVTRFQPLNGETILLLILLTAKIAWEQLAGPVPGSEATSGGPVVVDAHLYGAIGGVLGALLTRIRAKRRAAI